MMLLRGVVLGLAIAAQGTSLRAQATASARDTSQAPGAHYQASGLHRFLLGREYRSVWTTPIRVPILDLDRFGGGLTIVSKGGGQQTKSLLLRAEDGREFFFRSVDKDPSAALPPELRGTVASSVVRDQTSSAFPTAPLVVNRLLDAAGIPHGDSRLVVLPNDSRLGEFRAEFGGLMGFLEDRVGGKDGPPAHWAGASEIIGSDTLIARADRSPDDQVDARSFLKARLFDVLIGDWDRHVDQWVWARFDNNRPRRWQPIPRDRDQAFAKYDGFLLSVARQSTPQLTNFKPKYPYLPGATWNGRDLDRRFLVELEWPVWKQTAAELQARLTDSVIEFAVAALPPEHRAIQGETLADAIRRRRDNLQEAARDYYQLLAEQTTVRATAEAEHARAIRKPDGALELTLSRREPGSKPYFHRRFGSETKEVRLFLGPGDDRATLSGTGSGGPLLRVLGEEGQDELVDSSRGNRVRFYDEPGAPERVQGSSEKVDRRPFTLPPREEGELPPRDWGKRWTATSWISYGPDLGFLLAAGRTLTTYGFRKLPYANRHRFRGGFATGPKTFRFDYRGDYRRENSDVYPELAAGASGIEAISFRGFGNETEAPGDNDFYRVTQDVYAIQPSLVVGVADSTSIQFGPFLKYSYTDDRPDRFLATLGDLYGTRNFGEIGGMLAFHHDSRDYAGAPTKGLFLEGVGRLFPAVWDVDSTFGFLQGEARTYLSIAVPLAPTFAFRAGGKKLWGHYPFFESAFIGGGSTVRLGTVNRYAGDASAYGSAELRLSLARLNLILPSRLSVFGLADVGRVFLEGESSDTWHSAFGGGVAVSYLERAYTFSLAVASGEERTGVYVQAGFGF
jgi:hypothetical protein